jgi:hypothetical protein
LGVCVGLILSILNDVQVGVGVGVWVWVWEGKGGWVGWCG